MLLIAELRWPTGPSTAGEDGLFTLQVVVDHAYRFHATLCSVPRECGVLKHIFPQREVDHCVVLHMHTQW